MTRPLFNNSGEDLKNLINPNASKQLLEMIIAEVSERKDSASNRALLADAKARLVLHFSRAHPDNPPSQPSRFEGMDLDMEDETLNTPISPLPANSPQATAAKQKVKQLRNQLLDLRGNNRLINFKHSAVGRRYVRVIDEEIEGLFELLSNQEKIELDPIQNPPDEPEDEQSDSFREALEEFLLIDPTYLRELAKSEGLDDAEARAKAAERAARDRLRKKLKMPTRTSVQKSIEDYAIEIGHNTSFDLTGRARKSPRRTAKHWQTLLSEDDLERRLTHIAQEAKEAREELGVETLNVVFGFLEWNPATPAGSAVETYFSPIILQPVTVDKVRVGQAVRSGNLALDDGSGEASRRAGDVFRFTVTDGEPPVVNLTLRQRLLQDHNVLLPEVDPEENLNLELYFRQVETTIAAHPTWSVRRFVTITHLAFSRLPMWIDLDPEAEGMIPPHCHPVVGELFGGRIRDQKDSDDIQEDPTPLKPVPLVLDCDSSQYDAIKRVLSGKNLVIQGPPGTGKSQTIANMIAAAMGEGKTVLFVAEKQVALKVVRDRLASAGLGDFLLELHSAKAGRAEFLKGIRDRLANGGPDIDRDLTKETRSNHREAEVALNNYARILNTSFGESRRTIHDILWKEIGQEHLPIPLNLANYSIPGIEKWTPSSTDERRAAFVQWTEFLTDPPIDGENNPWRWVRGDDLHVLEQRSILDLLRMALVDSDALAALVSIEGLCDPSAHSLQHITNVGSHLSALGPRGEVSRTGLWAFARKGNRKALVEEVVSAARKKSTSLQVLENSAPAIISDLENFEAKFRQVNDWLNELSGWFQSDNLQGLADRLLKTDELLRESVDALAVLKKISAVSGLGGLESDPVGPELAACYITLTASAPTIALGRNIHYGSDRLTADIQDAVAKANAFRVEHKAIDKALLQSMDTATVEELESAAFEIDNGWIGSWFTNSKFRLARKLVKRLFPSMSRGEVISLLSRAIRTKRVESELLIHPAVMASDGLFHPRTGNLADLIELCGWVELVREKTPILETANAELRKAVFAATGDVRQSSRFLQNEKWDDRLKDYSIATVVTKCSPSELPTRLTSERKALVGLIGQLNTWKWALPIQKPHFDELTGHLQTVRRSNKILSANADVSSMFLPDTQEAYVELTKVEDAIKRITSNLLGTALINAATQPGGAGEWNRLHGLGARIQRAQFLVGQHLEKLSSVASISTSMLKSWFDAPLVELKETIGGSLDSESTFARHCIRRSNESALAKFGLSEFTNKISRIPPDYVSAEIFFDRMVFRSLSKKALESAPELRPFRHQSPAIMREKFRRLDSALKVHDQHELIEQLLLRYVPPGIGTGNIRDRTELALLEYVANQEKPRTRLRQILKRSGRALQAIKPCFLMSPLSVAQLIDRKTTMFDLVIFDEASQIKPEDAISALLRGRQFVVVGDQKQLPPTSFGDMKIQPNPDAIDDEPEEDSAVLESILELSAGAYGDGPMLRWHYRSRDPALIAFSNKEFYEEKLHVFPAPRSRSDDSGVKYVRLEGRYSARTNPIEAKECAAAAINFMRTHPHRSLGIVALNKPQAELIQLEVEMLTNKTPHALEYQKKWETGEGRKEEFFVKNLESVQGDERDVIFISTVFGPTPTTPMRQHWGPINSKVGHRRLNVLFTRAKHQTVVFSSIPTEQIHVGPETNWGVRALKGYLEYARTGILATGTATGRSADSPFEEAVRNAIEARGYQCEPQVGVYGFFIDLCVRNPSNLDSFLIGIECDGASYHSSKSARDRDRLRQDILVEYGWKLCRVWSTDWLADRERELKKVIAAIEDAKIKSNMI